MAYKNSKMCLDLEWLIKICRDGKKKFGNHWVKVILIFEIQYNIHSEHL